MNLKTVIYYFFVAFFATSCVSGYRLVQPVNAGFEQVNEPNEQAVTIQCSDIDLVGSTNPALQRKLSKNGFVFIPIKVENKSDQAFTFSFQTSELINDFMPVQMLEQEQYLKALKQKFWPNLLYVPAAVVTSFTKREFQIGGNMATSYSFQMNVISGLISAWALVNSTRTIWVNHKTRKNILQYDLLNKTIEPNKTVYGFICVKAEKINQAMVRIRN